ncbi:MAG: glycosyl hydrolase [Candidatus Micrarchaeaceae archaeon]
MKRRAVLIATIALATAILLVLLFEAVQPHNGPMPKHLNFVLGVDTHGNEGPELNALEHGVRYFRTDISLNKSEEALLSMEHRDYNASYLGILDYETLPGGSSNKNWSLSEWNASVANALAAYPWISTWEIWNEPLVQQFQTGYMNGSAYNYYMVIKSAAAIIRQSEPNATIVCFGGAPVGNYYALQWYAQVWNFGAANYCNAISIHAYPSGNELMDSAVNAAWNASLSAYEALTGKPVWITEVGMPSSSAMPGYSASLQSSFMAQSLSFFDKYSYIKRVYWYDLWGLSDGSLEDNFGLLNLSDPNSSAEGAAWRLFLKLNNESESKNTS